MKKGLFIFLLSILSIGAYSQSCPTVTISQSAQSICSGYSVTLTANVTGGSGPFSYTWNTGQTTPSISVDKPGTYKVVVASSGCSVPQTVTVTETTTPSAPTAPNVTVCSGSSATLTATGPGGTYQWYDSQNNFVASGPSISTPVITSNTYYYVQTTINGCTGPKTQVFVSLPTKPTAEGTSICSGNVATLTASGGQNYTWYGSSNGQNALATGATFTTPPLTSNTNYFVSSTDASGCTSALTEVTVTVSGLPGAPPAAGVTICSGTSANLSVSGSGVYNWYDVPSGGSPLISSPNYTTPPLTQNTTYYVAAAQNGCEGPRTAVSVTVNPLPAAPASQSDTICYQSSTTLTVTNPVAGYSYQWYNAPGGSLLKTGTSYTTPVLTYSTTYYIEASNGGCPSSYAPVNVVVRQQLPVPSAASPIVCYGSPATLIASSQGGGTFQWYSAATGGTLLDTGQTFTTKPITANITFYLQNTQNGCVSPRAAIGVSLLAQVAAPTPANATICSGDSALLSVTGSSGSYQWYSSATGGNLLSTNQVYVTPVLTATTTYYVEAENNGCSSSRVAVTATVTPTPTITTKNDTICPNNKATLTATTNAGTIKWYNAQTGGNIVATGPSYTTPVVSTTTTYYVESTSGSCATGRTPVLAVVNPSYNPQFEYSAGGYCVGSPNTTPTINNPNGGTFSAKPAGLVFVSTTTGELDISASSIGTYTVYFAGIGVCTGLDSTTIRIGATAITSFTYNSPFCQTQPNPISSIPGSYTASPAGLVFANTNTGEIDLKDSQPGTYTITNNFVSTGQCSGAPSSFQVKIYAAVIVSAGPDQTVATGTPVQLAGSISGGTTTGIWSTTGTGTFSNPDSPTAIYTPGAGETSARLTLSSADPSGPCGPESDFMTVTFTFQPAAPTVRGQSVCSGSGTTLSATAPGGSYQWYDAATGGNLLSSGPNFTTPALMATTTYYVQTTIHGVTSTRTAVTVTVNAIPTAPTCPSQQVCSGSTALLIASGSTGTYQWYDAPSGGSLLSSDSAYTTPQITGNISFYVQTTVNGCVSPRNQINVSIIVPPVVTSAPNGAVCSGEPHNYAITANQPAATFTWSRPAVTGISNPAVLNQTTSAISDTLVNTTTSIITVVYQIIPMAGQCAGQVFSYAVEVDPAPTITSAAADTVCSGVDNDYTAIFSSQISSFTWSRPAVPGISNQAVSGQAATTIREALFNTTTAPVSVPYTFTYGTQTCQGFTFSFTVTVNPDATITSAAKGIACYGDPQNYVITSNIQGVTYSWSRAAVTGISNPAVSNQTADTITETLTNTTTNSINVAYLITPLANGCAGTPFKYVVTVYPLLATPVANSNSPICLGDTIKLSTAPVTGASYLWVGPADFTSTLQNPIIPNASPANAGQYTVIYATKGCSSAPVNVTVGVDAPAVANAGPDQDVCTAATAVQLAGLITGGTSTGIWTTSGTGTFSPAATDLNAKYLPSATDKSADSVTLTLTTTSQDNCAVSTSSIVIRFTKLPAAIAGPNQLVCNQSPKVQLNGKISISGGGTWSSSGTGTFSPSTSDLNATYTPSATDIANGQVELRLTVNDPGVCYAPVDSLAVFFIPPAAVFAGGSVYVLKGSTTTLNPTVSESNVHYLWTPDLNINNDTLKSPTITGDVNTVYTLTVTDSRGCVSSDTVLVKVSPLISIPNTFTPNGDGVNDYWDINGLIAYTSAVVDIYDRYGQQVFHSIGYAKPWDGTYAGKQVPIGVYYYVIHTNFEGQLLSGWVTVIR